MPESKYSIGGIKNGISILFFYRERGEVMQSREMPIDLEEQVNAIKKYVVFRQRKRMRNFLQYAGYFRVSRYGKYLLSCVGNLGSKPKQDLLFQLYDFDVKLRNLLMLYCNKAEVRFKSAVSNAVSIRTQDEVFYLNQQYYTPTKSEKDAKTRNRNVKYFYGFLNGITDKESALRKDVVKYPELKEYRKGGSRHNNSLPVWAAFSYFEFGTITMLYSYLRGDLRKQVLTYAFSKERYKKEATKQVDTWLDAIRNLRNYCAHNSMVSGMTSSVVIRDLNDGQEVLPRDTDLFSRLYAIKKILPKQDSEQMKKDLEKLIKATKFDVYQLNILPSNWSVLFDQIREF
jgi:abortive infection bacteriophage resistance protein